MTSEVTVPLWLLVSLVALAAPSLLWFCIFPLWRAVWASRSRRVVEELNPTLQLKLSSFTLSRRRALAERLLLDDLVQTAVSREAERSGMPRAAVEKRAATMARDIVPDFNPYFYFRFGYWWARRVLRALYRVRIGYIDDRALRGISERDATVFVSNHRSNIDYLIINYLTAQRTMLSFAVGEWSRVWPIQPLMRAAGGYFVRRESNDPLYRQLLKRYVQLATESRVPHALFAEGELSKDGRIGNARLGLLSYITERFDQRGEADLIVVPIGNNYDRIIEDSRLIRLSSEQFRARGRAYVIWSGMQFVARVIREQILGWRSFGYAAANFGTPISFCAWLTERNVDWSSLDRAERHRLISDFGERIMRDISGLIPVTPVPLLCNVWRAAAEEACSRAKLIEKFATLSTTARSNGAHVVQSETGVIATVDRALELMESHRMLERDGNGDYRPNPEGADLIAYYARSIEQFMGAERTAEFSRKSISSESRREYPPRG